MTEIFCEAISQVIEAAAKITVNYSKTIQRIPKVTIKPDIGCLTQFTGDYNGLAALNFSAGAAMEIYRRYMVAMGIPEDELPSSSTSSEVTDGIGELTNQFTGKALKIMEEKYDVVSWAGQPKAIALNNAITLTIDSNNTDKRRVAFGIEGHRFHLELSMESVEFITE